MKKKNNVVTKQNKKEIFYNIVNSVLAGLLVFLGSLSSGEITMKGISFSIIATLIVIVNKFKEYWDGERGEYTTKLFNFIK
jgi:hypothetical protein